MWNVPPAWMCRKHLLGEHVEMHMFLGSLRNGIDLKGYIQGGLVEVSNIIPRHNLLVREMKRRGYNHQTSMQKDQFDDFDAYRLGNGFVDVSRSVSDLIERCDQCRERIPAMYEIYSYYKGANAVKDCARDLAFLQDLDTKVVEQGSEVFLFVDGYDRHKAVKRVEPKHRPKGVELPDIPPDPDNALSNFSIGWGLKNGRVK